MTTKCKSYQLKAWGTAPEKVEHTIPIPKGREVLIRVTHAGVCHSDVYIMDGYQDLGDGEKIDFSESTMPIPLTMGHEIVGEIVATGLKDDEALIGQSRLIYPWIGCGNCISCNAGSDNHCQNPKTLGIFSHGGYSDYVLVPDSKYLVDASGIDPAWACTLACSGVTIFSAFEQIKPQKPGSSIAIIGLGGLGLMAVSMAKALGFDNVIACDIEDTRLKEAQKLGAKSTLNTRSETALDDLTKLSNDNLYGVIDTVGLPVTVNLAIDACMKGGKIVLVGLQGGRIALPLPTLPFKALSLIGTYTGSLSDLKALIPLARSGAIAPMPIEMRPMNCLHETLEDLRRGEIIGRVVLDPTQLEGTAT